ncbi:hypothetical protein FRB93_009214 [Tulasnella sp. JGI-2019a]|nr:hypothetical protein FRB93_009214 [Tulasnella sp. JGI-2019a]
MSSDEDLHGSDDAGGELSDSADKSKRRKVSRACDVCRRKKIRCDAHTKLNMPKCSYCLTHKLDCTFIEGSKKRSPPKAYVDGLEQRIQLLEELIRRVAPTINIDEEVGPSFNRQTWASVRASYASKASHPSLHILPQSRSSTGASPGHNMDYTPKIDSSFTQEDTDNSDHEKNYADTGSASFSKHLENKMEELDVGMPTERRFHGKSSSVTLVQAALTLKEEVTGIPSARAPGRRSANCRPKFWSPNPWEWMTSTLPSVNSLKFPPPDLIRILVDHCFEDGMSIMPILHRPSFEQQYAAENHRSDIDFARLLLIVCSVGARYCNDARVCLTSPEGEVEWNSAGWVYFAQVYQIQKPLLATARLIDLQIIALSAIYLQGTSSPHAAWLTVGIGLRSAEDIGAHREKVYNPDHAFENQLWKRAFWCLVVIDKLLSATFGRPLCIQDEDIDTDLPLEADDENWDEVTQSWVQPPGKPSRLSYFVNQAKLIGILAHAMRTIYSIRKSKIKLGFVGSEWDQRILAEFDSSLNKWVDELPDHLRWNAHMDPAFHQQAAALRISFCYVQITIHRPFIQVSPTSKRVSHLSLPSLAICSNSARASAHILKATMKTAFPPIFSMLAFISGLVLMIGIWEARRSGLNVDVTGQIADVRVCLEYLRRWETRYHLAGRFYDILQEIAFMSDDPTDLNMTGDTGNSGHGNIGKRDRETTTSVYPERPKPTSESENQGHPRPGDHQYDAISLDASLNKSTLSHTPPLPASGSAFTIGPGSSLVVPMIQHQPGSVSSVDPSLQWPPPGAYNASSASATSTPLDPTWQNYHIAGSVAPGQALGFQMLSGFPTPMINESVDMMSSDSLWSELLGPWASDEQNIGGNGPITQPEYWNAEPMAQWNQMTSVPGMFGDPTVAHQPPQ